MSERQIFKITSTKRIQKREKNATKVADGFKEKRGYYKSSAMYNTREKIADAFYIQHRADLQTELDDYFINGKGKRFNIKPKVVKPGWGVRNIAQATDSPTLLFAGDVIILSLEDVDEDTVHLNIGLVEVNCEMLERALKRKEHASGFVVDKTKKDLARVELEGDEDVDYYLVRSENNGQPSLEILSQRQWLKNYSSASVNKQRAEERKRNKSK